MIFIVNYWWRNMNLMTLKYSLQSRIHHPNQSHQWQNPASVCVVISYFVVVKHGHSKVNIPPQFMTSTGGNICVFASLMQHLKNKRSANLLHLRGNCSFRSGAVNPKTRKSYACFNFMEPGGPCESSWSFCKGSSWNWLMPPAQWPSLKPRGLWRCAPLPLLCVFIFH